MAKNPQNPQLDPGQIIKRTLMLKMQMAGI